MHRRGMEPVIAVGYDYGMRVAVEICKLMDRSPDKSMSDLRRALPVTHAMPTLSPYAADEENTTFWNGL